MTGGYIKSTDGSQIEVVLFDRGTKHTYNGNLTSRVSAFKTSEATLTRGSASQLSAQRSFTGSVGTTKVTLTFGTNEITGDLDTSIASSSTVSGSGTWSSA